eukprot:CAMPEP_0115240100 /NCGR_PEP_ID=MMETSP0270-20121206/37738_1 /TAXON_ID=71861 /ORGANISM="Scrippsiella trochoidea, Strain CCMP3099" /LENGTH=69 /DNA_ID=CAMNT_0002655075 /DNA_START=451 /DNA_END=660 /DNA_ORIENTATION=+
MPIAKALLQALATRLVTASIRVRIPAGAIAPRQRNSKDRVLPSRALQEPDLVDLCRARIVTRLCVGNTP